MQGTADDKFNQVEKQLRGFDMTILYSDPRGLSVFFPGLLFGWMRSATGSILAGTICHALSNLPVLFTFRESEGLSVILPEADYRAWLTADWEEVQPLACPYPSQLMEVESPGSSVDQ